MDLLDNKDQSVSIIYKFTYVGTIPTPYSPLFRYFLNKFVDTSITVNSVKCSYLLPLILKEVFNKFTWYKTYNFKLAMPSCNHKSIKCNNRPRIIIKMIVR
uniref:Uncharacterized protein n=1 Tax=Cacopsylla melanoneura TaxID=428564 RepID=A0A8D8WGK6_9HEMI